MLRVFSGRPSLPQTAPHAYSVRNSWNGRLNASAFCIAAST